MNIYNHTKHTLIINNNAVYSNESYCIWESVFNTVIIFSDIGAGQITTEYNLRKIQSYGNLVIREIDELDIDGMRYIEIIEKEDDKYDGL